MRTAADTLTPFFIENGVAVVTMNGPQKRNAFSLGMRHALVQTFERLMHDTADCHAIVLTGAGQDFCAGGDLSEMTPMGALELRDRISAAVRLVRLIITGPKPVVAAVEGNATGVGLSLASACDYVVSSANAQFRCAFTRLGLLPDTGILWTLPRRVQPAKARELMLLGAPFDAGEALRIGFVDELAPQGHALGVAIAVARSYAQYPPITLGLIKAAIATGADSVQDAIRVEVDLQPLTRQTEDHHEAVRAFIEKRRPQFTGH